MKLTEKERQELREETLNKIAETSTWDDNGSKTMEMARLNGLLSQLEDLEHSVNNDKYKAPKGRKGHRVLITNMSTATECPERKAGHCQLRRPSDCYALRAELRFKEKCVNYRKRQQKQWNTHSVTWYVDRIEEINEKRRKNNKLTHHRWNEAGGIRGENDLIKASMIANKTGIPTFIYTSDEKTVKENMHFLRDSNIVINGSGFMAHNEYRVVSADYKPKHKKEVWCPDKCYNCQMCKKRLGITILAVERVAGKTAKRNK